MKVLTGQESFSFKGKDFDNYIRDFWAWNQSDLLNNTLRGALAEYIVAMAIGVDTSNSREDWAAYDLETDSGIKIEVKASAYLQSWNRDATSEIRFSIRPTRAWDAENDFSDEVKRQSHVYIFCVYTSVDKSDTPLDLSFWDFYVLSTEVLNEKCREQKTISLKSLLKLQPAKVDFEGINEAIEAAGMRYL